MRIDKFIGNNTDLSRTQIHAAMKRGEVKCNGERVSKTNASMQPDDIIELDNTVIKPLNIRYLMLHKPAGYVCANSDSEHPTVLDLLDLPHKHNLQIAGRLDLDTTGLVLLTDDGQWNHRVTAPRKACTKRYRLITADPIGEDIAAAFAAGVLLHGEQKPTLPALLRLTGSHQALLEIQEGKYHQVKRMFAAVGNRVISLHRESIGSIELDSELEPGKYRPLTPSEIASFCG
ncbi:MAG TPA: pseudouridine synthase [Cellvibrio sp.]|nr:pseudouridine synthase [Cellvibrio sp.]